LATPSGWPWRREHIEHRTGGRGLHRTAFQGTGENSFQPAEIYDLGADLAQMDRRQRLNLGARCPARFGENEQFLDPTEAGYPSFPYSEGMLWP
jgi:hypothetical protein